MSMSATLDSPASSKAPYSSWPQAPSSPDTLQASTRPLRDLPTPPSTTSSSDHNLQSTGVSAVLQAFRSRKAGKPFASPTKWASWRHWALSPVEYDQLQTALGHDDALHGYVQSKIRYDYFPDLQQLVIRMPSTLHDLFIEYIVQEIKNQLKTIAAGSSSSADFARRIQHCATANIEPLDPEYGSHSPDASFRHDASVLPGVVLEVSYTQKRRYLHRLADDYLLGSNHNIQTVVGLNLEYNGSEAALSVWRPSITVEEDGSSLLQAEQVTINEVFRGEGAEASGGLRVPLANFAHSNVRAQYPQPITGDIHIPARRLRALLFKAEEQHTIVQDHMGLKAPDLVPGIRKRRRASTPPEKLSSPREAQFQDDEHRAHKRVELLDSSFDGSTTSSEDVGLRAPQTRSLRSRSKPRDDDT